MAELDQETTRVIEFFVRDNLSRVVAELFNDDTTLDTFRAWLETEAAGKVAAERRRRICELAAELDLDDDTRLGDIRAQVDRGVEGV